jgi:hypothetical protein
MATVRDHEVISLASDPHVSFVKLTQLVGG